MVSVEKIDVILTQRRHPDQINGTFLYPSSNHTTFV